jgi:tripartite-type tricarboxylate transporter receptor subunit TctC
MIKVHTFLVWALLSISVGVSAQTNANYPNQPIRLMVPWPAGGGVDSTARMIAEPLAKRLGQPIVIENRAGAGGNIGTEMAARTKPDGYNLLMGSITPNAINVHLYPKLPFDLIKDFTPIIAAAYNNRCIVVHPSLPVQNLNEFIAYAKKNPGKLSYGVAASGSAQELAGDLLKFTTGIDMVPVPYKGGGPAMNDLLGGQIQVGIFVLADTLQHIKTGRLRALGIVEGRRYKAASDIPTVAQAGVPGFAIPDQWIGIFGPAGLPASIAQRINAEMNKTLALPEVKAALENIGYETIGGSPADFAAMVVDDQRKYQKLSETIVLNVQ